MTLIADLDELARLPHNWDSYGSPPIDPDILAAAHQFIEAIPQDLLDRSRVVPISGGNLQFEWHHGTKSLELEIETPETIHFLRWHPWEDIEEEGTFPAADIDRAIDLIRWFKTAPPR